MACRRILQIAIFFLCFATSCKSSRQEAVGHSPLFCDSILKEGDILLRMGRGSVSFIINNFLADTIEASHCGIAVCNSSNNGDDGGSGDWMVIHSLSPLLGGPDGMQDCSVEDFIAQSKPGTFKVIRCKTDTCNFLARDARQYLQMKIPFDEEYNMDDTTHFFCSQLPLHILSTRYSLKLFEVGEHNIPRFSLFLKPDNFCLIYP